MVAALTFLVVAAIPAALLPQNTGSQSDSSLVGVSLFRKQVDFTASEIGLEVALPDSFLIPSSEAVLIDSMQLQSGRDYDIDYVAGSLALKSKAAGSLLSVKYKIFPIPFRRSYSHRQPIAAESLQSSSAADSGATQSGPQRLPQPKRATNEFLPSNLRKSGSIVRGVTVGSRQSLSVDSGLRMQISGQLANDVEIVASLTDQNTPIQPEGNTQTLQEIDKVFIQLKSPRFQATLGDYNLNLAGTQFTRYDRKLEGVMGVAKIPDGDITLAAAVSRGQFMINEFLGQEGNQGPYQLSGENGNVNILVLAGTERVWIDGEQMARGESRDYVIEYGNGQITFTRQRLITGDSRIVVDFQFSDESFQRSYFAARGKTALLNDKLEVATTFIRESDDRDDPITLDINEDRLSALQASGDSLAVVQGWTFVGPDSGSYVRDAAGIFSFVGARNGDFRVIFSFFGPGQGDYRNIGLGRFEFVGENLGDYRPFIILPQAQQHDVVGLNLTARPTEFFTVRSELAFSRFDRNLYSDIDDGDNGGSAYDLSFDLSPQKLKLGQAALGTIRLSGNLRRKTEDFRDIDRTTVAEFGRRWNITGATNTAEEDILELQGNYQPVPGLSVRGGFGRLTKSSQFESRRWEGQTRLDKPNLPKVDYFVEFIDRKETGSNTSDWLRHRGRTDYQVKWLAPFFKYEGEIRKDSESDSSRAGFRFNAYTGGLRLSPWKRVQATASYNIRDDDDRAAGRFDDKSIARTQSYTLGVQNWHAITVAASYTRRKREFNDPATQDTRTDLADVRVSYRPPRSGIRGNLNYQISNTQVARQEEVFIEVPEGEGNFRFNEELREFEPDPFGTFVRRLFSTKDFTPVVELRMRTDLRMSFKDFFKRKKRKGSEKKTTLQKILWPVSTETFFRIDERSTEEDVKKIYLLNLGSFQQDSTTIFGSIELRQDVHLWENSRKASLRYRFRNRNELNNQFIGGGQDREVREQSLRLIKQISGQFNMELEGQHSEEDRIFQASAREDRKVRTNEVELDLVYRPQQRWEIGSKARLSRSKDLVPQPNTRANLLAFAPRATYSLSKKGRVRGELEFTHVGLAPKGQLIPFELTGGNRAGNTWRWNLGFDYRVSQNVQATMTYFGRSEPDRPDVQHVAKVEVRAFF